jgi:hypothetical protein
MSKLLDVLLGFCTHGRYTFPARVKADQRRFRGSRRDRNIPSCAWIAVRGSKCSPCQS